MRVLHVDNGEESKTNNKSYKRKQLGYKDGKKYVVGKVTSIEILKGSSTYYSLFVE
jgi:hypothetical protein